MAAQKGRAMLLKTGVVIGATTIGCQVSTSITINNEQVDITNKDSAGIKTLLEGAGVTGFAMSVAGIFDGDTGMTTLETAALANTIDIYSMFFGDGSTWTGSFAVTSFEYTGENNGAQQYTASFESSGAITVA